MADDKNKKWDGYRNPREAMSGDAPKGETTPQPGDPNTNVVERTVYGHSARVAENETTAEDRQREADKGVVEVITPLEDEDTGEDVVVVEKSAAERAENEPERRARKTAKS